MSTVRTTPEVSARAAAHCTGSTLPLVGTVLSISVFRTVAKSTSGPESLRPKPHHRRSTTGRIKSSQYFFISGGNQRTPVHIVTNVLFHFSPPRVSQHPR